MAAVCFLPVEEGPKSKEAEELLCNSVELPVTIENTRKIMHDLLHEKLRQIQQSNFNPQPPI